LKLEMFWASADDRQFNQLYNTAVKKFYIAEHKIVLLYCGYYYATSTLFIF
jgi:hypothetical protein